MREPADPIYRRENVPLFEAIYGKNFISLGSIEAVERLFTGISLHGVRAIDIGSGLGGVAFYLAKQYQMHITGVEVYPWMAKYAEEKAPTEVVSLLNFTTYNNDGTIPVGHGSQDLVYSKGVLNHVHNKAPLFQQVNLVLKSQGLFVIADWLHSEIATGGLYACETKSSYKKLLEQSGFREIEFRDENVAYLDYVKRVLKTLQVQRGFIEKNFGKGLFTEVVRQHEDLVRAITESQKFATRILAKKC